MADEITDEQLEADLAFLNWSNTDLGRHRQCALKYLRAFQAARQRIAELEQGANMQDGTYTATLLHERDEAAKRALDLERQISAADRTLDKYHTLRTSTLLGGTRSEDVVVFLWNRIEWLAQSLQTERDGLRPRSSSGIDVGEGGGMEAELRHLRIENAELTEHVRSLDERNAQLRTRIVAHHVRFMQEFCTDIERGEYSVDDFDSDLVERLIGQLSQGYQRVNGKRAARDG